jgi:hypothetical protein
MHLLYGILGRPGTLRIFVDTAELVADLLERGANEEVLWFCAFDFQRCFDRWYHSCLHQQEQTIVTYVLQPEHCVRMTDSVLMYLLRVLSSPVNSEKGILVCR